MSQSLSVVLTVHNAEKTLVPQIHHLLEVLPDLTVDFEILVIDDGSTDQTEEIAWDLARKYPQLRVARHPWRLGIDRALKTGLESSTGDIVFVHEGVAALSPSDLRRLWELRTKSDVVIARTEAAHPKIHPNLLKRIVGWGKTLAESSSQSRGGIQMIRRAALNGLEPAAVNPLHIMAMTRADVGSGKLIHSPKFAGRLKNFALGE